MLNCLAAAVPGGERVISAEEVYELRFPHANCSFALSWEWSCCNACVASTGGLRGP